MDHYAYCTNAQCSHLARMGRPYATPCNGGLAACPHCFQPLCKECPACGYILEARPLRYCPACGQRVLESATARRTCAICGRPVLRTLQPGETVVVCSDSCLAAYMQRYIRICDNCGKRFDISQDPDQSYVQWRTTAADGTVVECCSESCHTQYINAHGGSGG